MKVKITPIGESAQLIEFNVSLPCGSLTSRTYWLKHKNIKWLNRPMRQDLWQTKFSSEYVNSPDGKVAAENLLATIRKSKEYIQSQIKAKEEKVNTLLELMESDPEMKKRFDELMMNKTAK